MNDRTRRKTLPLIYACSGCSSVAQLANDLAVTLDHQGRAEMSCISGVGGEVPALVKAAKSGRKIIAIDGCPLHCTEACLNKIEVAVDHHVRLYDLGIKKKLGIKASAEEFNTALRSVEQHI
jgi:uncharacterized metal-binding protein